MQSKATTLHEKHTNNKHILTGLDTKKKISETSA
jgi:hypothetical protein